MAKPCNPLPAKLIIGMISREPLLFEKIKKILSDKFGKIDMAGPVFNFNQTHYYENEMGADLKRQFLTFEPLVRAERLTKIKLLTNSLEKKFTGTSLKRAINIDPGYLSLSKLVLATTKNYSHRIYAGCGIFEEITLCFKENTFQPLPWTYPDYRSKNYIDLFNDIRKKYYIQIENTYGLSQLSRCV